jgi:peptidoglycan-associated lipoprotein
MRRSLIVVAVLLSLTAACAKKQPTVAVGPAPPPAMAGGANATTPAPTRVDDLLPVPPQPPSLTADTVGGRPLDDPGGLNGANSPFRPVYFQLDSSELDDAGRAATDANAEILKKNPSWIVTIEGHCDERGSAEYNLALGEKRAGAVRTYLLSLGIPAARVRTVSYGKEYPFDPGHTDDAWSKNRRGQFVITSR